MTSLKILAWFNPIRNPMRLWKDFTQTRRWFKKLEEENVEYRDTVEKQMTSFGGLVSQVVLLLVLIQLGVSFFV